MSRFKRRSSIARNTDYLEDMSMTIEVTSNLPDSPTLPRQELATKPIVRIVAILLLMVALPLGIYGYFAWDSLCFLIVASGLLGLIVLAMVVACYPIDWGKKPTSLTWDFTKSWASNITAAGTILNYAVLLSCFTPTASFHYFPKSAYLSIGAIAGGLSLLAPLAYNALSKILQVPKWEVNDSISFLVGAGITVWGSTLQLLGGACLLDELRIADILPSVTKWILKYPLVGCAFLIVVYAIVTTAAVLKTADLHTVRPPEAWTLL
jgi:hypothetical protein